MALTKDQVQHIAHLARLELSEEELTVFTAQLSSILEYVEKLQTIDTKGIEQTAQVTGLENVMREDEAVDSSKDKIEQLVDLAPDSEDNLIKTKSVFE